MEEKDDELDFQSPSFNPLKALSSENVQVPFINAPVYDNLTKFNQTDEGIVPVAAKLPAPKKDKKERTKKLHANVLSDEVKKKIMKDRIKNNVLTKMTAIEEHKPLGLLKRYVEEKIRIKVVIRGACGVRGYCTGILQVFDKHWNMVLLDVMEIWKRRKSCKPSMSLDLEKLSLKEEGELDEEDEEMMNEEKGKEVMKRPKEHILKRSKTYDICEREIGQLYIRGQQIVTIYPLNPNAPVLPF